MTHQNPPEHFKGKSVPEHLKEARLKGAKATKEIHGTESPGHLAAGADSIRNTTIVFLLLWAYALIFSIDLTILFIIFTISWTLWKTGRSALLGWARLERLHKVIEEERFEIEHHREQEKQELRQMYADKGFSGELLDKVVDVLIADDNRLLQIMLEEELGLSLEVYEHPLKQALGAGIGVFVAGGFLLLAYLILPVAGLPIAAAILMSLSAGLIAKIEKRSLLLSVIWNLALTFFVTAVAYFLAQLL